MTEMTPMEKLSDFDRETPTVSPRISSSSEAYGLNTADLFGEEQWFDPGNTQFINEQHSWVEFSGDKTNWEASTSLPGTVELCHTPMSLSTISAAPTGYLTRCHDAPDCVEMSRTSSESSVTWEHGLDVMLTPDSTNQYRKAVDQRYAYSEHGHPFGSTHDHAGHAKRISQTAWACPQPECGKSYSRRDTFLRHQNSHKVDSHPCKICSREKKQKSFKRKDHLKEHVRKCHSGRGDDDPWHLRSPTYRNEFDHSDFAVDVGMGSLQQQRVTVLVEALGNFLGDQDSKMDFGDFRNKMTALSDSDMKSVVGSMASVGATMAQTILSATTELDHPAPEYESVL